MGLFDFVKQLKNVGGALLAIWNLVCHFYQKIKDFFNHLLTLFDRINRLISDIETEVHEVENFAFNPHWKTRVISVPIAYQKIHRLSTEIPREIINAVKDVIQQIRNKVQ